jgi:hypothetical protein
MVAVDTKKKKIVSLDVTSEEVHDGRMLKKLVDNASSMKRMFGEYVSARKFPNIVKEMFLKASLYNIANNS